MVKIGETAVQVLLNLINEGETHPKVTKIPFELIKRKSTK